MTPLERIETDFERTTTSTIRPSMGRPEIPIGLHEAIVPYGIGGLGYPKIRK
jgi:hypothetical protein